MKSLKELLLLFSCLLMFSTFSIAQGGSGGAGGDSPAPKPKSEETSDADDWQTISDNRYTFSCPSDWQKDESSLNGTTFFVYLPQEGVDDNFQENINLVIQDLNAYGIDVDLDQFVSLSKTQLPNMFEDFELISSEKRTQNGKDFYEIQYKGNYLNLDMQWKQRVWLENNIAYILSFTALQSTFDSYDAISDKVMDTFDLK